MKTTIIAEMGSCHEGTLDNAMALINVAKNAGADIVKGQYWSSSRRLVERRNALKLFDVYERYRMPTEWLSVLKEYCDKTGIEWLCTVYLPEDIEFVAQYVKRFKIASFEAGDKDFIQDHHPFGKPIIISTGMMDAGAVPWIGYEKTISRLHCTSAYPAPNDQANLRVLKDNEFCEGFSDHTKSLISGAVAVACGATILEKHFKLKTTSSDAPDYEVSLWPSALQYYIDSVREAERLMGDGLKRIQPSEQENVKFRVK